MTSPGAMCLRISSAPNRPSPWRKPMTPMIEPAAVAPHREGVKRAAPPHDDSRPIYGEITRAKEKHPGNDEPTTMTTSQSTRNMNGTTPPKGLQNPVQQQLIKKGDPERLFAVHTR